MMTKITLSSETTGSNVMYFPIVRSSMVEFTITEGTPVDDIIPYFINFLNSMGYNIDAAQTMDTLNNVGTVCDACICSTEDEAFYCKPGGTIS